MQLVKAIGSVHQLQFKAGAMPVNLHLWIFRHVQILEGSTKGRSRSTEPYCEKVMETKSAITPNEGNLTGKKLTRGKGSGS